MSPNELLEASGGARQHMKIHLREHAGTREPERHLHRSVQQRTRRSEIRVSIVPPPRRRARQWRAGERGLLLLAVIAATPSIASPSLHSFQTSLQVSLLLRLSGSFLGSFSGVGSRPRLPPSREAPPQSPQTPHQEQEAGTRTLGLGALQNSHSSRPLCEYSSQLVHTKGLAGHWACDYVSGRARRERL